RASACVGCVVGGAPLSSNVSLTRYECVRPHISCSHNMVGGVFTLSSQRQSPACERAVTHFAATARSPASHCSSPSVSVAFMPGVSASTGFAPHCSLVRLALRRYICPNLARPPGPQNFGVDPEEEVWKPHRLTFAAANAP